MSSRTVRPFAGPFENFPKELVFILRVQIGTLGDLVDNKESMLGDARRACVRINLKCPGEFDAVKPLYSTGKVLEVEGVGRFAACKREGLFGDGNTLAARGLYLRNSRVAGSGWNFKRCLKPRRGSTHAGSYVGGRPTELSVGRCPCLLLPVGRASRRADLDWFEVLVSRRRIRGGGQQKAHRPRSRNSRVVNVFYTLEGDFCHKYIGRGHGDRNGV